MVEQKKKAKRAAKATAAAAKQEDVEIDGMEGMEAAEAGDGRMLTALAWVPRGHAKAVLELADPMADERNIMAHSRLQKKLAA